MKGIGKKTNSPSWAFSGKVIIITGASEGLGRALCLALAPQQPMLALAARNEKRLIQLKEEVEALGAEAIVIPTDVSEREQCRALIEKTVANWGHLDILVNNAGMGQWTLMEQLKEPSIYENIMRTNFLGGAYCTFYAVPYLKRTKGQIAAVASALGMLPAPTHTAYCASKHAMFGFYGALRIELKDMGVSVTIIAPGFVATEIHKRSLNPEGNPLGRNPVAEKKYMPPEKVAAKIVAALEKRKRLLITARGGSIGRLLYPVFPSTIEKIIAKDFVPETSQN